MFCKFFSIVCRYRMYQVFYGCNASMVFKANGAASFPESLRIHTLEVSLSLMVTSAPLWLLPITVSISKSPNRSFKSTIAGRSSISIRHCQPRRAAHSAGYQASYQQHGCPSYISSYSFPFFTSVQPFIESDREYHCEESGVRTGIVNEPVNRNWL